MDNHEKDKTARGVIAIIGVVIIMYAVTTVLLFIFAFMLYKVQTIREHMDIGIILIYVISTVAGGYAIGKRKEHRKMIWGAVAGLLYFVVLSIASVAISGTEGNDGMSIVVALLACIISGMAGSAVVSQKKV